MRPESAEVYVRFLMYFSAKDSVMMIHSRRHLQHIFEQQQQQQQQQQQLSRVKRWIC